MNYFNHKKAARYCAVAVGLCMSCADNAGSSRRPAPADSRVAVVRDSSGIAIVENDKPILTGSDVWRVVPTPELRIGSGATGDALYQFSDVRGALRLRDSSIAVVDWETDNIRIFDSKGKHLRTLGRKGDGPCEFKELLDIFPAAGDSLRANSPGRMNYMPLNGGECRVVMLSLPLGMAWVWGAFESGRMLAHVGFDFEFNTEGGPIARTLNEFSLSLLDANGSELREIKFATGFTYTQPRTSGFLHFGPRGYREVGGSQLVVAFSDKYEIRIFDENYLLKRIIRRTWSRVPVTAADVAGWKEAALAGKSAEQLVDLRRHIEGAQFAEVFPAHEGLKIDRVGNIWVQEYRRESKMPLRKEATVSHQKRNWNVFDNEGRWISDVSTPSDLEITDIGEDYVLGTVKDRDGVPFIWLCRLLKSSAGGS